MNQDAPPADAAAYVFGSFTLDPRFRRLLHHNSVVPLTTKAFDTLEALVQSAGRTVTKDELLKQVWTGTFVQEDTLAQNISTIRRALGDTADAPRFVLTIPREGYRFIAPVEVVHPVPSAEGERRAQQQHAASLSRPVEQNWNLRWRFELLAGAGSVLALVTVSLLLWSLLRPASPVPVPPFSKFEIFEPDGNRFSTSGGVFALSPDGHHLVFIASDTDGRDYLWIRPLDSLESRQLPETLGAAQPFWSADSRSVAFFSGDFLRRIDIAGGPPRLVCKLPGPGGRAGSWSRGGTILFAVNAKGLFQVPASGGTATPVIVPGRESCRDCLWPSFLPDGRQFLFTVVAAPSDRGVFVSSLDGATPRRVLDVASSATYTEPGYLFYASAGGLVARRFDPSSGHVSSDEVPVVDHVWHNPGTRRAVFSVSQAGLLAYREPLVTRLQLRSRKGDVISTGSEGVYQTFAVSRDGRVLTSELEPRSGTFDLYLHDASWSVTTRLTFDAATDVSRFRWSADQSRVVFAREGPSGWQLYDVAVNTPGVERPLLPQPSPNPAGPFSWDGNVLQYSMLGRLWTVRPGQADAPALISEFEPNNVNQVSPDGKWLAHTMNAADSRPAHRALLMRPLRGGSGRWEIATEGAEPRWRSDSSELFFIAPGGRLMAQRVDDGGTIGPPAQLCVTEALEGSSVAGQAYDVGPDGQRFLLKIPARRPSIIVMSGWPPHPDR